MISRIKSITLIWILSCCFIPSMCYSITQNEATEILIEQVLDNIPHKRYALHIPSYPLDIDTEILSSSDQAIVVQTPCWFAFVDLESNAFYGHDTLFVLINDQDGSVQTFSQNWWPTIDGVSIYDMTDVSRIYMSQSYPDPNSNPQLSNASKADYGDAPDGGLAYENVPGRFPTLYHTANSLFGLPGGHVRFTGEEMLGVNVSEEIDALDPDDPDGVPNMVDSDRDEGVYIQYGNDQARLAFKVTVTEGAPEQTRYINALLDFNSDGQWSGNANGTEWAVINMEVNVQPGTTEMLFSPWFDWQGGLISCWSRIMLTRAPLDTLAYGSTGWDGSGQFEYGEIEDMVASTVALDEELPELPQGSSEPGNDTPPDDITPTNTPTRKGPCDTVITTYTIIINGGDHRGQSAVQNSVDKMREFFKDSGFKDPVELSPNKLSSKNSKDDIHQMFKKEISDICSKAKCVDEVFIYICAHGYEKGSDRAPEGGFQIMGRPREENPVITPSDLGQWLCSCAACPGGKCEQIGVIRHLTIVIESCYSGNFMNLAGSCRTIIGTSNDTCSWGTQKCGFFTEGFLQSMNNTDNDIDNDNFVDANEAFGRAKNYAQRRIPAGEKMQEPWCYSMGGCSCDCSKKPLKSTKKPLFQIIHPSEMSDVSYSLSAQSEYGPFYNVEIQDVFTEGFALNSDSSSPSLAFAGENSSTWYADIITPDSPFTIDSFTLQAVSDIQPGLFPNFLYVKGWDDSSIQYKDTDVSWTYVEFPVEPAFTGTAPAFGAVCAGEEFDLHAGAFFFADDQVEEAIVTMVLPAGTTLTGLDRSPDSLIEEPNGVTTVAWYFTPPFDDEGKYPDEAEGYKALDFRVYGAINEQALDSSTLIISTHIDLIYPDGIYHSFSNTELQVQLIIDDFENYLSDYEGNMDTIWWIWMDGRDDYSANGSQVGYPEVPSLETEIVHSGRQSMPFYYNNTEDSTGEAVTESVVYRIAESILDLSPYDYLSLWIYSDPNNSEGGQFFVEINYERVYAEADLTEPSWQQVDIPLNAFNMDMDYIYSLNIGVDGTDASGLILIDDIGAYNSQSPESSTLLIDDFEDYPSDVVYQSWIYDTWLDGYFDSDNGSIVGNDGGFLAETEIVHSGRQSMPFYYNNTEGATESVTSRTFDPPQDWSKYETLSLWVHGDTSNTDKGQFFIGINEQKTYVDIDLRNDEWQEVTYGIIIPGFNDEGEILWTETFFCGVEDEGASGVIYIDDIELK